MVKNQQTNKKEIREQVLQKRRKMTQEEWEKRSILIYEKTISHSFFLNAEEIYCYADYKKEVGTRMLIEKAWELGKKVAVPKIVGEEMSFYYIDSFDDMRDGYCHILEPITEEVAEGKEVLIVMPGAVFDCERNRIGYGKGFYDRYLEKHPSFHTLALAFELQIVENIPVDKHDKKPEAVITEENIYV